MSLIVPNWWLAKIAEMSNEKQKVVDTHVIYAILVAVSIIIMTASSLLFYYILLKASETLHNKMTISTIKAPVLFSTQTQLVVSSIDSPEILAAWTTFYRLCSWKPSSFPYSRYVLFWFLLQQTTGFSWPCFQSLRYLAIIRVIS